MSGSQAALQGRVAIVTGASRGIGFSIAFELLSQGAYVALLSRSSLTPNKIAELDRYSGQYQHVVCDTTRQDQISVAVQKVRAKFEKIDILVHNQGGARKNGNWDDMTLEDFKDAYTDNVLSLVALAQELLPDLSKSKFGRIITLASKSGVQPGVFNPHYCASKAALINLTKYLSNHLAKRGICVNAVSPGIVRTEGWEQAVMERAEREGVEFSVVSEMMTQESVQKIPLGRMGSGQDVAGLVAFLASDSANWITGSTFHVNGGGLKTAF